MVTPRLAGGPSAPCYPGGQSNISNGLAGQLRRDLGDQAVTSMKDQRLATMHGYYVQGWESAFAPGADSLGKDWKEVPIKKEPGKLFPERKYVLEKEGSTSRQEISVKMYNSVTLTSTATVGGKETTEVFALDKDSKVKRTA